jgi:hypothetical protein
VDRPNLPIVKVKRYPLVSAVIAAITLVVPAEPALAAPGNDNIAAALLLGTNSSVISSNVGATLQFQESSICGGADKSVWYKWTAPANGYIAAVTISATTAFNTIVDLYSGPPSAQFFSDLSAKDCNDNIGLSPHSAVSTLVLAGGTYYVKVAGAFNSGTGTYEEGTFKLQINFNPLNPRHCATTNHFFSVACVTAPNNTAGARAAWAGLPLNISQDGANAGGWIAQSVWYYNNPNNSQNFSYLEITDSGGTGFGPGNPKPYLWERWWKWVDGYTDGGVFGAATGTYTVNYMQVGPNDGVRYHRVIKWESGTTWSIQTCTAADVCTPWATKSWLDPAQLIEPRPSAGLEVSALVMNDNANTGTSTFQDDTMQIMNTAGAWGPWPASTSDTDNGCPSGIVPFCLNGVFGTPYYDNWQNNKPQ